MIQFNKIDLSKRLCSRDEFVNKPRRLVVFPDNVPDCRLARNKLHNTGMRAGLAHAMRPEMIGGTELLPQYDINAVGIPTLSYLPKEPFSKQHIEEAFATLYGMLNEYEFDFLDVPYKNGEPAFGGGVAGPLPEEFKTAIAAEFTRLEQFLSKTIALETLPASYQDAYKQRHLATNAVPFKRIPKTAAQLLQQGWRYWVNQSYPRAALGFGVLTSLAFAYMVVASYALPFLAFHIGSQTICNILAGSLGITIAGISMKAFPFMLEIAFGKLSITCEFNNYPKYYRKFEMSRWGILAGLFDDSFFYKPTLAEVESQIHSALLKNAQLSENPVSEATQQQVNTFTRYYATLIIENNHAGFYEEDKATITSPYYNPVNYDLDAAVIQHQEEAAKRSMIAQKP